MSGAEASAVLVLGMHRSGTSAAAAAIEALGFDLGPAASLLPAVAHDNPRGYAEQRAILDLNEELLALLGGTWWRPPTLQRGWERATRLNGIRHKARATLASLYGGRPRWVVKDPRIALTLPFWLEAMAPVRPAAVICVRGPAAVATSLQRRVLDRRPGDPPSWPGVPSRATCDRLWWRYTSSAWRGAAGLDRSVVVYERFVADPAATARGLARALGVTPNPQAAARIDPLLAHHARPPVARWAPRSRAEWLYLRLARRHRNDVAPA